MSIKLLPVLLLITGCVWAQTPKNIPWDSLSEKLSPRIMPPDFMPSARPDISIYRKPGDQMNVMRATIDNMPVKVPDSSTHYTMLRAFQNYVKPEELPLFKHKLPRVPKKH